MAGRTRMLDPDFGFAEWMRTVEDRLADLAFARQFKWINLNDAGGAAPAMTNSWVAYGAPWQTPRYAKLGNMVVLQGLIKNGTIGATFFTLPVGVRPPNYLLFAVDTNANVHGRMDVQSDGQMIARAGSNVYFGINAMWFV